MIQIVNNSKLSAPRKFIQEWVLAVYQELDFLAGEKLNLKKLELTIVFLDPVAARKINQTFRAKNYATDVLSFGGDWQESLGELLLCPQVLRSQAEDHGLSYKQELGYMLVHGVLHLMGFDHEKSKKEERIMFAVQDLVFDELCKKFFGT